MALPGVDYPISRPPGCQRFFENPSIRLFKPSEPTPTVACQLRKRQMIIMGMSIGCGGCQKDRVTPPARQTPSTIHTGIGKTRLLLPTLAAITPSIRK